MVESGLMRRLRAQRATEDDEALIELFAALLPDLLLDAMNTPAVRTAILNITRAAQPHTPTPVPGRKGVARRG